MVVHFDHRPAIHLHRPWQPSSFGRAIAYLAASWLAAPCRVAAASFGPLGHPWRCLGTLPVVIASTSHHGHAYPSSSCLSSSQGVYLRGRSYSMCTGRTSIGTAECQGQRAYPLHLCRSCHLHQIKRFLCNQQGRDSMSTICQVVGTFTP